MNAYLLLFFLGGPLVLAIGNLILGPIFNRKIPFSIHLRSFIIATLLYLIGATILYFLLLQDKL